MREEVTVLLQACGHESCGNKELLIRGEIGNTFKSFGLPGAISAPGYRMNKLFGKARYGVVREKVVLPRQKIYHMTPSIWLIFKVHVTYLQC